MGKRMNTSGESYMADFGYFSMGIYNIADLLYLL